MCQVRGVSGLCKLPRRCREVPGAIWAQNEAGSLAVRVTRVENTKVDKSPPKCILPGEPRILTFEGELEVETGRLGAPSAPEADSDSDSV